MEVSVSIHQSSYLRPWPIVESLSVKYLKDGDTADKSTKFCPCVLYHHSFQFGVGATSPGTRLAAILDLKMAAMENQCSANSLASR